MKGCNDFKPSPAMPEHCMNCRYGIKLHSQPAHDDKPTDYAELPRAKMRKVTIAFDVDGTLRSNDTETTEEANQGIVELFLLLDTFKNTDLYVWSGGGADYARRFARLYELPVKDSHCISKFGGFKPDIAIDDIQETNLGTINLIVRAK